MRIAPQDAAADAAGAGGTTRPRRMTLNERLELFRLQPLSSSALLTSSKPQHNNNNNKPFIRTNLSYDKVRLGSLLGTGAYASVYNVSFTTTKKRTTKSLSSSSSTTSSKLEFEDQQQACDESRNQENENNNDNNTRRGCNDSKNQTYRYALKCLQQDRLAKASNEKLVKIASTDFLMEAKILSKIALISNSNSAHHHHHHNKHGNHHHYHQHYGHPNIIGLVGVSSGFYDDPCRGFLILEKVSETLSEALIRWANPLGTNNSSSNNNNSTNVDRFSIIPRHQRQKKRLKQQQGERIRLAALGIARALQFLHEHRIIYRDIKPANIGFSQQDGQVRLLDFGLARQVHSDPSRRKRMSGNCGTPRYMAPEVMLEQDYSFPADVHSYALLLWEILTLTRPYNNAATVDELLVMTIRDKQRPPLGQVASSDMKAVLKQAWSSNAKDRPSFQWIVKQLEFEVDALQSSSSSDMMSSCNPRK